MVAKGSALPNARAVWLLDEPDLHCRSAVSRSDSTLIVNAPMNGRIFETWIETQLAPTLSPGDVVIRKRRLHPIGLGVF
ncbi:Transposase (plasmid) [Allorhizobium ampelinum S4]|uniref:Transposase n=1 Tax=Allorhizobium ampelinum (strain ATCC BAA-846 / DSM 112012 / S4) TaxID=311402 RepID=B9K388_ALLAM|nr:Transposase [Allorhizobium ampelinum S4]